MNICAQPCLSNYFSPQKTISFSRFKTIVISVSYCQMAGVHTVLATTPMGSGYWCVRRASRAVKEHRPAVKRMKKGNSFLGYTDTSWKAETAQN